MSQELLVLPRDHTLPESLPAFSRRFSSERSCAKFLRRWKYGAAGFRCPRCGSSECWYLPSRHIDECRVCHKQVSLTSGTVMHGTRKPLRLWFHAMYEFVVSKQGISATELARRIGVTLPTAWTWLHKLRAAAGTRPKEPLRGDVEVDETYEGGLEEGKRGRPRVGGKKALVAGAIEIQEKKWGRLRLGSLKNATAQSLTAFLMENVEAGSTLLSDYWPAYIGAAKECGLAHVRTNVSRSQKKAHELLPAVHRVFSLLHRVLLTTFQGAVSKKHLPNYLAEYVFRFNRRTSASRVLLFQRLLTFAVRDRPPYYWEIIGRPDGKTPLWKAA